MKGFLHAPLCIKILLTKISVEVMRIAIFVSQENQNRPVRPKSTVYVAQSIVTNLFFACLFFFCLGMREDLASLRVNSVQLLCATNSTFTRNGFESFMLKCKVQSEKT